MARNKNKLIYDNRPLPHTSNGHIPNCAPPTPLFLFHLDHYTSSLPLSQFSFLESFELGESKTELNTAYESA